LIVLLCWLVPYLQFPCMRSIRPQSATKSSQPW
jgi:hypothetical protein